MKKIIYAVLATVSGLVLLFSYRTSLDAIEPTAVNDPAASSDTTTNPVTTDDDPASSSDDDTPSEESSTNSSADGSSSDTSSGGSTSSTASGLVDGRYTGGAANTRYGPVQVQITVSGGRIADVQVVRYPNSDRRDREINARAIPILVSETTQAQSSQVDMVSGATYTSRGYVASLQSAIDQAQS